MIPQVPMDKECQAATPEITCLGIHCRKTIELPSYVNDEQYDGDLRCEKCLSLMHISLREGIVVKYSLKDDKSETTQGWKNWAKIQAALEDNSNE